MVINRYHMEREIGLERSLPKYLSCALIDTDQSSSSGFSGVSSKPLISFARLLDQ
jgi:hypothetical protein